MDTEKGGRSTHLQAKRNTWKRVAGAEKGPFFQQGVLEGVPEGAALELSFLGGQKR